MWLDVIYKYALRFIHKHLWHLILECSYFSYDRIEKKQKKNIFLLSCLKSYCHMGRLCCYIQ